MTSFITDHTTSLPSTLATSQKDRQGAPGQSERTVLFMQVMTILHLAQIKTNSRKHTITHQSEPREDIDWKCPIGTAKQWSHKSLQETGAAPHTSMCVEPANGCSSHSGDSSWGFKGKETCTATPATIKCYGTGVALGWLKASNTSARVQRSVVTIGNPESQIILCTGCV